MSLAGRLTAEERFHRTVFLNELFGNSQEALFGFLQRIDEAIQYFTLGISAKHHFNLDMTTRTYRELHYGPETRVGEGACTLQEPLCINLPALALDVRATEHVYVLVPAFEDRDACTDVMAGPSILRTLAPGQLGLRKPKPVLHWPTAALHSLGGRGGWQPLHVESGQRLQLIGRGVPIYDVLFKQKECPDKYASSERRPPPSSVVWEIRIDPADQVLRHPTMAPDPSFHLELHYHLADLPCPEYQPMPRAVLSHFHPSQHFLPAHRHRSVVPSPYSTGVQGIAVHGADEFQGNPFYG